MFRFTALTGGLLLSVISAAATLDIELSKPPAVVLQTNAYTHARVQYGTCQGDAILKVLGEKIVPISESLVSFEDKVGVYCIRAYWFNAAGESAPVLSKVLP